MVVKLLSAVLIADRLCSSFKFLLAGILCLNECVSEEKKLDILVNNAGATWIAERTSVDGFESIFATNHLGTRLRISADSVT